MQAEPPVAAVIPAAPTRLLNPDPVIDAALGIIVTEYFNAAGNLTSQYPTRQMLDAYGRHGLPGTPDDAAVVDGADHLA